MYAVVLFALVAVVAGQETYNTKYDNINIDEILKNERLFSNYINCIMDRGNCTPEGEELKSHIPDGIETDCAKCSAKQKQIIEKLFKHVYKKKNAVYKELEAKYDPKATYIQRHKGWVE